MFQIRMPIKCGGLGLPALNSTRTIAYLASVTNTLQTWRAHIDDTHPFFTRWLTPPDKCDDATPSTVDLEDSLASTLTCVDSVVNSQAANLAVSTSVTNSGDLQQIKKSPLVNRLPRSIADLLTFTDVRKLQHRLCLFLQTAGIQHFETNHLTTQEQKAHYLSKTGPHAAAFLQTIPSERALTFHNREYLVILYTYLQMPVLPLFKADPNSLCACGGIDANKNLIRCTEEHILNCGAKSNFTRRHDAIKEIFMEMFRDTGFLPKQEQQCDIGSGQFLRYDITVGNLLHANKILHLDITIPNPCAKRALRTSSVTALSTADAYVSRKNLKYGKFVNADNFFTPMVIETYGAMHPLTEGVIRRTSIKVNHVAPERAVWTAPNFCAYYFQRISCALQKMNAQAVDNVVSRAQHLSKSSRMDGQPKAYPTSDYIQNDIDSDDVFNLAQDHHDDGPELNL